MKNPLNYFFKNRKTMIISFSLLILFEILVVILTIARPKAQVTWITFFNSIMVIIFASINFVLFWFKKNKAAKVLVEISFFLQAAYTMAYSFYQFPKTPNVSYATFVVYIMYSVLLLGLFINLLVYDNNFNESINNKSLMSLEIIDIVIAFHTLITIILIFVNIGQKGYSADKLIDVFAYLSYACLSVFGISADALAGFDQETKPIK